MPFPSEILPDSQVRVYDRAGSVVFLKTKDGFGGLSNMASGFELTVAGLHIRTAEALYQACRFPRFPDVQRLIIDQASPMAAKMKSKPYAPDTRPDWTHVRVSVMRWCLRVKLAQNWREFGELLLATGDRPIVEESRRDGFWGAQPSDGDTLVGVNVLGRLLMELRQEMGSVGFEGLRRVAPLSIPDFLLDGRLIAEVSDLDARMSRVASLGDVPFDLRATQTRRTVKQRTLFEESDWLLPEDES